jgi:hypothetical protein
MQDGCTNAVAGRHRRGLAALGQAPDVDEAADLALALEGGAGSIPEFDPIAGSGLDVDDDVADDDVVHRFRNSFPTRVPRTPLGPTGYLTEC